MFKCNDSTCICDSSRNIWRYSIILLQNYIIRDNCYCIITK